MSSMLARYHHPAQEIWTNTNCRTSYTQSQSYAAAQEQSLSNSWFTGGLPTPPGTKTMNAGVSLASNVNVPTTTYRSKYSHDASQNPTCQQQTHHATSADSRYSHTAKMNAYGGITIPVSEKAIVNEIASHLQIPESVNKSKGSLAEFASEIASLFWFESAETLQYAEDLPTHAPTDRGLVPDAIPSTGFRKWVTTILSTTQVGKNVILLGLLFIHRLKKFNPGVSGKRGSEFRLLTIALMLGNKFLDDNTYTNKTWAEVSGISVGEIHIMEVEFLSNMRYDLYVSAEEWTEWKTKLGRLGAFYEKALKYNSRPVAAPITPTFQSLPHKLPSPPSQHTASTRTFNSTTGSPYANLPNPMLNAPQLNRSPLRNQRYGSADILDHRKRSVDLGSEFPPAKRLHYSGVHNSPAGDTLTSSSYTATAPGSVSVPPQVMNGQHQATHSDAPLLPMPRLPGSTSLSNGNYLAPINLPSTRAINTVYPTSTTSWSNTLTPVTSSAPQQGLYQHPIPTLGEMSRPASHVGSAHTSPNGYSTTPIQAGHSPSYFLTNRSSPYRPVRHVNTLLIPPPSAALQNPVRNIGHDQMHYQPLSKAVQERRSGPVPYYQPEGWQQSNASTPLTQKYRF